MKFAAKILVLHVVLGVIVLAQSQPANLQAVSITASSATLSWSGTGSTSCTVQVAKNSSFNSPSSYTSTSGSVSASSLSSGTVYWWRVKLTSGNTWYNGPNFTTVPSPPSDPDSVSVTATSASFRWNKSTGATSYGLQVSTLANFSTTVFDQVGITTTTYTVSGLSPGTKYYWRVSATNSGGTSSYSSVESITTILEAPFAPTLSAPADTASGISIAPTLSWNQVGGATSYTLQVSILSSFTTTLVNQSGITGTSSGVSGLSNNTKYYWRVSATNAKGTSPYSSVRSFTTIVAAPAAPTLFAPADAASDISIAPTLSWNQVSGAASYALQVSTSSSFTTTVVNQLGIAETSSPVSGLTNNTKYYWRVSAINAGGTSPNSSTRSFTTIVAAPPVPSLTSPADNTTGVAISPTMSWGASSGATTYRLQISTSSDFSSTILDDSSLTGTSKQGGPFTNNTKFYWRVSATNAGGTSAYSSTWSFTTIVAAPAAPTLSSPANDAGNQPVGLALSWNAVQGATSYRFQLSTSSNFTPLIVDDSSVSGTSRQFSSLSNSTTYYWRVSAINAGGMSPYSGAFSFTTIVAAPSVPTILSPLNSASGVSTSPTLTWSASSGATSYHIQLSPSSSFTTLIVDDSTLSATSRSVGPLINSTRYYWRVSATNAGGVSQYSPTWSFTTIVAAPPAPTLSSPANGARDQPVSLTLGWNASSGATSYHVQLSTSSTFSTFVVDDSTLSATSLSVGPLSNSTQYYWRVSATNAGGTSQYSPTWSFTTIVATPAAPTLSSPANTAGDQLVSLTLSWNAAQGATSYRVQLSTSTNFTSLVADSTLTGTSFQPGMLSNSTQYFWRVTASNAGGSSAYSSVFSFTTIVASPAAPVLLLPQNNAGNVSTSPTLTWSASNGAASYSIQVSTASDFSTFVVTQSGITGTSYSVAALSNNTQYYWRTRATNIGGSGPYSAAFMFTTIVAPPGAPALTSPANNTSGIGMTPTLGWAASAGATRYRLQLSTSSTFNSTILDDSTLTSLSRPVGPLSNNTTYYWRLSATNDGGTSSYSTAFSFTTISAAPSAPSLRSPANSSTGVTVNPILTWNASADAVSFTVQVSIASDFSSLVTTQSGITGTSFAAAALSNNRQYYWRVNASNTGGTSPYSAAFSFTTVVAAPAAPTLSSPSNGSASVQINPTLSWNASSGATSYTLQVSTTSDFSSLVLNQSGIVGTSFNVVSLSNNTQYYWRVSAANAGGSSAFSAPFPFTTIVRAPEPPTLASPSNGTADVSTSPTLSWNASSGATSYAVQLSTSSGFSTYVLDQSGVTSTSINVPGLANSTQYFWRVSATNSGGTTAFSSVFSFTTAPPAPAPPVLSSPANGITGIPTNPTLSWNPSGGAVTYTLHVSISPDFSSFVVIQSGITGMSFGVSGLSLNTLYYWRVNTTNSAGTGSWSSVWSFTTAPPPPSAPALVSPSNGATGLSTDPTLSWNSSSGAASYYLQVSTASDFSALVVNLNGMTSTSHSPSGLNVNTQHYWRVSAANAWGTSSWSSTFSFKTLLPIPSAPDLSSPADGSINVPRAVSFSWTASPNAVTYHLQLSTNSSFTLSVLDTTIITSLSASVTLELNTTYYWRVAAINPSGEGAFSSTRSFTIVRTTAVEQLTNGIAAEYSLSQNYPNPFNPSTTIQFSLPSSSNVRITIYNALGNLVHLLVNGHYAAGRYTVTWDASSIPSGVYFYRLQTESFVDTKRLVLLK